MDDQAIQLAEKIDRYLQGKMNEEEHKSFEYQIAQDADLREEVENTEIAQQAIHYHSLRMEVKEIRERMLDENVEKTESLQEVKVSEESVNEKAEAKIKKISPLQYSYSIAAGIILLMVSYIAVQTVMVSPESLYSSKIALDNINEVSRGNNESTDQTALLDAYQQEDFEQVVAIYSKSDNHTATESYYAAASYLQLEQYRQAVETYKEISTDEKEGANEFILQESTYKLALTYIREGEYDQAMPLLNTLNDNYPYYDHLITDSFMWKLKLLQLKDSLFN